MNKYQTTIIIIIWWWIDINIIFILYHHHMIIIMMMNNFQNYSQVPSHSSQLHRVLLHYNVITQSLHWMWSLLQWKSKNFFIEFSASPRYAKIKVIKSYSDIVFSQVWESFHFQDDVSSKSVSYWQLWSSARFDIR